jgi:hypothetical protein
MSAKRESGSRSPEAVGIKIDETASCPLRIESGSRATRGKRNWPSITSPKDLLPIELDLQHRLTCGLLHAHIRRAANAADNCFDLLTFGRQQIEVVPVKLDGQVSARAGNHFIHPHFDRLEKRQPLSRHIAQVALD